MTYLFPVREVDLQRAAEPLAQDLRAEAGDQGEGPERAEHRGPVGRDLHHDDHRDREERPGRIRAHHLQPHPEGRALAQGKKT